MKVISLILFLSIVVASQAQATPTLHSHGTRIHNHSLPVEGVGHSHSGGVIGSSVANGGGNTIVTTHGDKANIINQPNTVIINNTSYSKPSSQPKKKNDAMTQYFEDIEISLKSCIQKSNSIRCKFIIKNTDKKDIGVSLNANSFIIDADGDTYYAYNSLIKFGNLKTSFPYKVLVQGIPVKAEMTFKKVESQGGQVPLLKFGISGKKSKDFIEFRNINLK